LLGFSSRHTRNYCGAVNTSPARGRFHWNVGMSLCVWSFIKYATLWMSFTRVM
jgi:hypothetical protein